MSTADYSRFVALGNRMLAKYGAQTTLTLIQRVASADKPWEEGTSSNVAYSGLQSAKFDPIKRLTAEGKPLQCDATFYISMDGIEDLTDIPYMSTIVQTSEPNRIWSVVKAELIKPAETGCLWIVWVTKYASVNG